jgi:hypothetical protein
LKLAKHTRHNWLFIAIFFSFLTVVGSGSVAVGDLLNAPNTGAGFLEASSFANKRVSLQGRWLGSKRLNAQQLDQYSAQLGEYGVTLSRGREATSILKKHGARAAFDSFDDVVYLRKNATAYDAFHELQHVKHRAALGQAEYRRIGEYARERHVFEQVFKNRSQFNREELRHGLNYLRDEKFLFNRGVID